MLCVCSGRCLDPLVSVVWLLCDLWSGDARSNQSLHQPPAAKQRLSLQRTGERNTAVSDASMFGFVYTILKLWILVCSLIKHAHTWNNLFYLSPCRCFKQPMDVMRFLFHLFDLSCLQMTFAHGRHGHLAPGAVVRGQCRDAGSVCVSRELKLSAPLRSRQWGTVRRPSCATTNRVRVQTPKNPQSGGS